MSTTGSRRLRALEIFEQAVEMAAEDRVAYVDGACGDDEQLRAKVHELIEFESDNPDFMARPIVEIDVEARPHVEPDRLVGRQIGAFKLIRVIGVGGMSVVYEARQLKPNRTVAIKVMQPGLFRSVSASRFELEAEILGSLHHPAIAQVYDAGFYDDGSGAVPYFAMELVDGAATITDYADDRHLDTNQRIELLTMVCDAVAHGHDQGIIHRDLKPDNILVDTFGRPKVIDFGIARATDADLAATITQTKDGDLIGTVQYMSPEQCRGRPGDISERSDVYSLGVVAYELLGSGERPYDTSSTCLADATRMVIETVPRRLGRVRRGLHRDVDTIVMTALAKEPGRRYQTAAELGADLRCYLEGKPIAARPPSVAYRLTTFVRRRRWQTAAALLTAVSALAVAVIAIVYLALVEASTQGALADLAAYGHRNGEAEAALQLNDVGTARKLLGQVPEDRRGWEWRHLHTRLDHSIARIEPGGLLRMFALGPNRLLATMELHRIEVFDGQPLDSLAQPVLTVDSEQPFGRCLLSPAGDLLVVSVSVDGDAGYELTTWDLASGWPIGHSEYRTGLMSIAFAADGSWLATGENGTVQIRDPRSLTIRCELTAFRRDTRSLAVDPHRNLLAAGSADHLIKVWSMEDPVHPRLLTTLRGHDDHVAALAFEPTCGNPLASGSIDGTIKLWDMTGIESGDDEPDDRLWETLPHPEWVAGIAFSPDGRKLASGGGDRAVRIWRIEPQWPRWDGLLRLRDRATRQVWLARELRGHDARINQVAFTADGEHLLALAGEKVIRVWTAGTDSSIPALEGHLSSVQGVAFVPGEPETLVSIGGDYLIRFWDTATCEQVRAIWLDEAGRRIALHPTKRLAAMADEHQLAFQGGISVIDLDTGQAVIPRQDATHDCDALTFSPDGQWLAWGEGVHEPDVPGRVMAIRAEPEAEPIVVGAEPGTVNAIAFSTDGTQLATGGSDGRVHLWSFPSGGAPRRLEGHTGRIRGIAYHPTEPLLASASEDQTVRVWDLDRGVARDPLTLHAGTVWAVAFSPDGTRLATGSSDQTVRLWDVQTGTLLVTLRGHRGELRALCWSPDGATLASTSTGFSGKGNEVRLWETSTDLDRATQRARARLLRERVDVRVERLFVEHRLADLVIEAIAGDPWFDQQDEDAAALRDAAVRLAGVLGDDWWRIMGGCWRTCRVPGRSADQYRRADEQIAPVARRLGRRASDYGGAAVTVHGMAAVRVGRYEEAVSTLELALEYNGPNATDLAFLSMARWGAGDREGARLALEHAQQLIDEHAAVRDPNPQELVDEARSLIDGDADGAG